ncbi:MAG TPA: carboxypeptidase-like regulatory domain-containing protein, partial [Bryobacteraceae bacterium]|nr:carboxypeptidase-like regulatory domain-containing protein [Bryobacteraceae bacterium]
MVLRNQTTGNQVERTTPGDGVFLLPDLIPGAYQVTVTRDGFQPLSPPIVQLSAGEAAVLDITLLALPAGAEPLRQIPGAPPGLPPPPEESIASPYRELRQRPPAESVERNTVPPEPLPEDSKIFTPVPNRWQYEFPKYRRYPGNGDIQYVEGRPLDPFNRNKAKGDYPIFGNQTFLNLTVTSDTLFDRRVLPVPSGVGSANPDSGPFYGNFGQYALSENVAVSATLFHGDAAFRPIDWQIRFTPEFNFNYLAVQENGIVNIDVRKGTTRYDQHAGLQEAFAEV